MNNDIKTNCCQCNADITISAVKCENCVAQTQATRTADALTVSKFINANARQIKLHSGQTICFDDEARCYIADDSANVYYDTLKQLLTATRLHV